MLRVSSLLSGAGLAVAIGWLTLSEQSGMPLSAREFVQQLRQVRSQVLDQPTPATAASLNASPYAALEQAAHDRVNQYRTRQGLSSLRLDPRISEIARQHSENMASGRVPFGHGGFDQRVQTIARTIPYRQSGENVAFNRGYPDPVAQAVTGWIDSSGHRQNMEGDFEMAGMGVARTADGKYYFTQIFIRPLF